MSATSNSERFVDDLNWVYEIFDGNGYAWNRFVEAFSDRIWRRSWQLCMEACPYNRSTVFCVFHALNADDVQPTSDERPGCDEGLEIYAFIFDYLYNAKKDTGKLKHYDGRSNLEAFVGAVLHGNLRTDWIRHKRKLRVDQITHPDEIKRLPELERKVFEQMMMQRPTESIARHLSAPYESVEVAQERVTHALMANGNLHLILRSAESSLDDELGRRDETMEPRVIPMQRAADALWTSIGAVITSLSESSKILLDMAFDQELDANTMLERCNSLGIELPVTPRTGKLTIHSVYQSIDLVLRQIGEALEANHRAVLEEAHNWLEDESVAPTVSVKGLKTMLKTMGTPMKSPPADPGRIAETG
jgi:hypothetical protein